MLCTTSSWIHCVIEVFQIYCAVSFMYRFLYNLVEYNAVSAHKCAIIDYYTDSVLHSKEESLWRRFFVHLGYRSPARKELVGTHGLHVGKRDFVGVASQTR